MDPMVTIAIPTYERLGYLKEAVGSALDQTHRNVEILIGDDGCDQLLREWCEQQVAAHSEIRYHRNNRNLGLAGNWNALVDAAQGEFIVIIGDDDRLLPNFVGKCVAAILPDRSLVFSNHYVIDAQGNRLDDQTESFAFRYGRKGLVSGVLDDAEALAWRNAIPISASLLRTADAKRLRFKEDLNNPEIEFFIRLARAGGAFFFLEEHLIEYRAHSASATASAGLKSDLLVDYLLRFDVRSEMEPLKAELLRELMINAVSRSILGGQAAKARELLRSNYYPSRERTRPRGLFQTACTSLPEFMGRRLYTLAWNLKRSR
jgi:glycosyltransferase involved in cell wall biosynthesis